MPTPTLPPINPAPSPAPGPTAARPAMRLPNTSRSRPSTDADPSGQDRFARELARATDRPAEAIPPDEAGPGAAVTTGLPPDPHAQPAAADANSDRRARQPRPAPDPSTSPAAGDPVHPDTLPLSHDLPAPADAAAPVSPFQNMVGELVDDILALDQGAADPLDLIPAGPATVTLTPDLLVPPALAMPPVSLTTTEPLAAELSENIPSLTKQAPPVAAPARPALAQNPSADPAGNDADPDSATASRPPVTATTTTPPSDRAAGLGSTSPVGVAASSADTIADRSDATASPSPASGHAPAATPVASPIAAMPPAPAEASAPSPAAPSPAVHPSVAALIQPNASPVAAGAIDTPQPDAPVPADRFAQTNHPPIVSAVRANLLPHGGTMRLELNPPGLGTIELTVRFDSGTMSASFSTATRQAADLLGSTLTQLKTALEQAGLVVDRLQVQQAAPRDTDPRSSANSGGNGEQRQGAQNPFAQSGDPGEQQRREMLRKLWQRVTGNSNPVDYFA